MKKKLTILLDNLSDFRVYGTLGRDISGITDDSRKVKKGTLFVAINGLTVDGHKFIPDTIGSGAVAIVGERKPRKSWLDKITYIKVPSSRRALAFLASAWYNHPSKKLKIIGVTGTDGKTTTANLIYWILRSSGEKAGLISTINAKIGDKEYDTGFHVTNPEPFQLQKFLAKMVEKKCKYAVLEVTSHGLDQERVAGIDFDVAVLTNITHEHLDYHKTWRQYRDAKVKLFKASKVSVLNYDDESFSYISKIIGGKKKVISYGVKEKADYLAKDIEDTVQGTKFTLISNGRSIKISTKLHGDYNVHNTLASIAVAKNLKIPWKKIESAISSFKTPIGRLEEIKNRKGFKVYVDFAHTPNALENVLNFLKIKKQGKLIAVLGSAGERDFTKREQMGGISGRLVDISIFTAEDPRNEDVNDIIS
ncbi:UDP-N-acetylmuramoyl-L-alanyl-D-glutamate--2,6-diaminopimelate ligase, partial [Patescibacteria group bacterium]|nr:UDP-N-acetylmuramoyl-L-alanyl-D-glutamate--2,6-diaminopimelate ligase [Patescibacteria group bacterium]